MLFGTLSEVVPESFHVSADLGWAVIIFTSLIFLGLALIAKAMETLKGWVALSGVVVLLAAVFVFIPLMGGVSSVTTGKMTMVSYDGVDTSFTVLGDSPSPWSASISVKGDQRQLEGKTVIYTETGGKGRLSEYKESDHFVVSINNSFISGTTSNKVMEAASGVMMVAVTIVALFVIFVLGGEDGEGRARTLRKKPVDEGKSGDLVCQLRAASSSVRGVDSRMAQNIDKIIAIISDNFDSFSAREIVLYSDKAEKLKYLVGPDYYQKLVLNPEMWDDPEKKRDEVREAVANFLDDVEDHERRVCERASEKAEVSLRSLSTPDTTSILDER